MLPPNITRRNLVRILLKSFALLNLLPTKIIRAAISGGFHASVRAPVKQSNKATLKKPIVVCIHDREATTWDFSNGYYIDFINQERIDSMFNEGLMLLTGTKDVKSAWLSILPSYSHSDTFALKPNFNCADKDSSVIAKEIMTCPQILNAIIKSLMDHLGVKAEQIYIYDLCRPIPNDPIKNYIPYSVNYVELPSSSLVDKLKVKLGIGLGAPDKNAPVRLRAEVINSNGNRVKCYMPKLITKIDHIINVPVAKYHQFGVISGPLKNHYGTIRFGDNSLYPEYLHGNVFPLAVVDINRQAHIVNKTRLNVVDFLFGSYDYKTPSHKKEVKKKWKTFPFGEVPNSLLLSLDPVATESVMRCFIATERVASGLSMPEDAHLKDAMSLGLGVYERISSHKAFKHIKLIMKAT